MKPRPDLISLSCSSFTAVPPPPRALDPLAPALRIICLAATTSNERANALLSLAVATVTVVTDGRGTDGPTRPGRDRKSSAGTVVDLWSLRPGGRGTRRMRPRTATPCRRHVDRRRRQPDRLCQRPGERAAPAPAT